MAVFPDRIILKNSTDNQATIEAAIQTGGADAISQGEIVLGIEPTNVRFYTKAGDGTIVSLGSAAGAIAYLGDLLDVDLSTPATDGQLIAYNSTSGNWEPVDSTAGGLQNIVEDTTPQLGGNLDTNSYYIISTSGDISLAPATGEVVIRGGTSEGKLTLNCTANTHGVSIQSPPHAAAATYTLTLPNNTGTSGQVLSTDGTGVLSWADNTGSGSYTDPLTTDGDIVIRSGGITTRLGIGTEGQVLKVSSGLPAWEADSGGAISINDLTDVDTNTTPPTQDQVLVWDGTNWVPGDQTGGSGGGSIAGTVLQKEETQTASSGAATFTELGESGVLVSLSTTADAWVALYPTAADRTADASRAYGDDPAPGAGVLAEFYVTTAGAVLASPGTTYFNNDTVSTSALYAAVRDQAGASVAADITIKAYVHQGFGGVGTARATDSGTASSGLLTLTGMGQTGQFCTVTSSLDAWVVFYGSDANRTADNARTFATDPAPGSGVQAEFYIAAGTTVLATPGSTYFNNDASPTDAMYLAVRNTGGSAVNSLITVTVYAETSYTGISGGTFGSG